jgi:hypothetical protein
MTFGIIKTNSKGFFAGSEGGSLIETDMYFKVHELRKFLQFSSKRYGLFSNIEEAYKFIKGIADDIEAEILSQQNIWKDNEEYQIDISRNAKTLREQLALLKVIEIKQ